jgi:hypothetical protein
MSRKNKITDMLFFSGFKDNYQKLLGIKTKYKLVIMGTTWCTETQKELQQLNECIPALKEAYDTDILYISTNDKNTKYITSNKALFVETLINNFNFKNTNKLFPVFYILNENNEIIAEPTDAKYAIIFLHTLNI